VSRRPAAVSASSTPVSATRRSSDGGTSAPTRFLDGGTPCAIGRLTLHALAPDDGNARRTLEYDETDDDPLRPIRARRRRRRPSQPGT